MQQPGMTIIATVTSLNEGLIIQSVLESSQVTCVVDADDAGRTNPEFDLTRFVRVLVRDEEVDKAREILKQAQENGQELPEGADISSGL